MSAMYSVFKGGVKYKSSLIAYKDINIQLNFLKEKSMKTSLSNQPTS